jgi:exodeoxyribonuclease V alpha subunit
MDAIMEAPLIKDELQTKAIQLACGTESGIVGITGQAGTGKTTIMKQVHAAFVDAGYNVALAAPTGKAARRISEATGIKAMTIHRLLEFTHPGDPDEKTGKPVGFSYPRRNENRRLGFDVVLVDEYSMVNTKLNRQLIDAMAPGSLLRVFGDANQLPPIEDFSVGHGPMPELSPFKRYLREFPSVVLKNIYRQGEGSDIVRNAHRILHKMCPQHSDDFRVVLSKEQEKRLLLLVEADPTMYASLHHQVITPTHRGPIGTRHLNKVIQEIVQKERMAEAHVMPRYRWDKVSLDLVIGDKILWTNNDYHLEIFNGEIGVVLEFMEHGHVVIDFGDRVISVPPLIKYDNGSGIVAYDPRVQIRLAYAITTHASQGSEYESIIYAMDRYAIVLQDQSNFYTGVTRARKRATVISDQYSFQKAVVTPRSLL